MIIKAVIVRVWNIGMAPGAGSRKEWEGEELAEFVFCVMWKCKRG